MKIIKRSIPVLLLLVTFGSASVASAATALTPSVTYRSTMVWHAFTSNGCKVSYVYGQYGTDSFAQVKVKETIAGTYSCKAYVNVAGIKTGQTALTVSTKSPNASSGTVGLWSPIKQATLANSSVREVYVTTYRDPTATVVYRFTTT